MGPREVQGLSGLTDRRRLPLLEDEDLTGEAVIEPSRLIRPVDAPAVAVACFFRDVVGELSGRQDARPVCRLHSEMGPASLWEIEHRGVRLGVFHPGVGAPLAGAMLEQVIARGVRGVIACGAAGALVPEHGVILTGAVRDEGTSFHYLPAGRVVSADPARDHTEPAKFTVAGPSGHEIGQLADAMTCRTRDCSPDATGVVPKRGRDHARRHLRNGSRGSPGSRLPARLGNTISHFADDPGNGIAHHGTQRQAQDADVDEGHDAADPGPCTTRAFGRSVMKRIRIGRPRFRNERPGLRH